jgi:ethanolamine utilization protein EutN
MYLARVVGTCTATIKTPGLLGRRLLVLEPITFDLVSKGSPFIAVDSVNAGPDSIVFYVTSREAAKALDDPFNPVDAAIMGIVDEVRYSPWSEGGR